MRHLPLFVLLGSSLAIANAEQVQRPASATQDSAAANHPGSIAELESVTPGSIWDPTGALLAPYLATRLLGRQDYFAWCLRWNQRQETLVAERTRAPRTIRGWATDRSSYSRTAVQRGYFGRSGASHRHQSTTRTREQLWYVDAYGGGPVTVFNPFVAPR